MAFDPRMRGGKSTPFPGQPMPLDPSAQPPQQVDPDQAMGRFNSLQAKAQDGPDQAARAAYLQAQSTGQDPMTAAREAWKTGVTALSQKLHSPDFQPSNPGEQNLQVVAKRLMSDGADPASATAIAHEFLATQAQQAQAQPGGQPGTAPPPPMG